MVGPGKRHGKRNPVVLLSGEDDYLKREYVARMKEESPDPCGHDYFDGDECSAGDVVSACLTMPFGDGVRLVMVRSADRLLGSGSDILLEYMASPSPTTWLVLLFDKLDRRSKLFREARRRGWVHDCSAGKEGELLAWLKRRVRDEFGKELDPDAARLLIELAGSDRNTLANEVEKLCLFTGDRKAVRREDVEEISVSARQPDIWALMGAVADKDEKRALRVFSRIVRRTSDTGGILGLLRWNINRLWMAREMIQKGVSAKETGRRLKVWGTNLDELMKNVRASREKDLYRNYRLLLKADSQMKTGQGKPLPVLERLIVALCS